MTSISWQLARFVAPQKIPEPLRKALLDPSSTTQKMRKIYGDSLRVHVVSQTWKTLPLSESRLLHMKSRTKALVREVEIYGNSQVLMLGRSVFPATTLTGKNRFIRTCLDNRPLGDILYSDPSLQRSPFELAELQADHCEFPWFKSFITPSQEPLWARRSIFLLRHKPVLLTEVFLPAWSKS